MTRAYGGFQVSPFVSSTPSILLLPRTGLEMFMIIACDGFWDTTPNHKAHNIVFEHLNRGGSPDMCALLLRDYALSMGSQDNISVLCVIFSLELCLAKKLKSSQERKRALMTESGDYLTMVSSAEEESCKVTLRAK